MLSSYRSFAEEISAAAQLAMILEVSGYPKPGNVHRLQNFEDVRFEHFLASAIAMGATLKEAAARGIMAGRDKILISEVGVGRYIDRCIQDSNEWHHGGNTWLGAVMLLVPLAVGAGLSGAKQGAIKLKPLQLAVRRVIKATTMKDTVQLYRAIRRAEAGGLVKVEDSPAPDINSPNYVVEIKAGKLSPYDVMKICSRWDTICREWATGLKITFEIGYPALMRFYNKTHDINVATVHTFLTILAATPDTLVARKQGMKKARRISANAKDVLAKGGLLTEEGRRAVEEMDLNLKTHKNRLNPGTTADLTASSLMVAVLCGLRP